jgi:hypothetical protein
MTRILVGLMMAGVLTAARSADAQSTFYFSSFTDTGTPSYTSLFLVKGIAPLTGLVTYTFAGSIAMTDATGDGVSAAPKDFPEFWRLFVGTQSSGFLTFDVGGTSTLSGAGPFEFSTSGVIDCSAVGACTSMHLAWSFETSGFGDVFNHNGTFTLEPASVPEPHVFALLGIGLAGLGTTVRRRRGGGGRRA